MASMVGSKISRSQILAEIVVRGVDAARRESAHSAGVRTFVVVEGALVVLRGDHRLDSLPVGEREDGDFGTGEEFLDDHAVSGVAEDFVVHYLVNAGDCVLEVLGDDDALAEREPFRLYDGREGVLGFDVVYRVL